MCRDLNLSLSFSQPDFRMLDFPLGFNFVLKPLPYVLVLVTFICIFFLLLPSSSLFYYFYFVSLSIILLCIGTEDIFD